MIENHEILCPTFVECDLCQTKRDEINRSRIKKLFGIEEDIQILTKHFYCLTISVKPDRQTYFRFSLEPLKKTGRELINGLSSLSSVSNRSWWSLFVEKGCRFYSVEQKDENDFPVFNNHFIFYSSKDNLDSRMDTQLKYRLRKISNHFTYTFDYLGQYDLKSIENSINLGVSLKYGSIPMEKLGEDIIEEIYKIKGQKPVSFGGKYQKKSINKLETITN
jgi:hypothetical protein